MTLNPLALLIPLWPLCEACAVTGDPRFHHRTFPNVTVGDKVPGAWLVLLFLMVISMGVGEEIRPPVSGADRPAP